MKDYSFILSVLGVVLVIEGIPYIAFPGKVKEWALAIQDVPDGSLRLLGLIITAAGLILAYAVSILGA